MDPGVHGQRGRLEAGRGGAARLPGRQQPIKFNKYGALASIEEGVAGLVHVSEFGSEEKLRSTLELGKTYPFTITLFEPKDQRMTLSFSTTK